MEKVLDLLLKEQDEKFKLFQAKLIPTVSLDNIIGVKAPKLKSIAKSLSKEETLSFMSELPHKYLEEYLIHAYLINEVKDLNQVFTYLDAFLPYVDNWSVCDSTNPKIFKKYPYEVYNKLKQYIKSNKIYTKRFAIVSLMRFYLDSNFHKEDLLILSKIKSDEYYINMAIAWYYSFALIKQYDDTVKIFEKPVLSAWIQNKTIQKAIESFRISKDKKEYLKTLKIINQCRFLSYNIIKK